ncbi:unnamed protein product [Protopolystoma xenopodis]|uniref:Uncharacterized protein n=1 Tax=Protopolystoma xenopodis TaxID=117903 RepID=A0A3S5BQ05_9PLAT|nr:unnamed protein product [Protopolystoma xenopodis]
MEGPHGLCNQLAVGYKKEYDDMLTTSPFFDLPDCCLAGVFSFDFGALDGREEFRLLVELHSSWLGDAGFGQFVRLDMAQVSACRNLLSLPAWPGPCRGFHSLCCQSTG